MTKSTKDFQGNENSRLIQEFEIHFIEINRLSHYMRCDNHDRDQLFRIMLLIGVNGHFLIQNAIILEQLERIKSSVGLLRNYIDVTEKRETHLSEQKWTWIQIFKALNYLRKQIDLNKANFKPLDNDGGTYEIYFTNYFKHIHNLKEELNNLSKDERLSIGYSFPSIYNQLLEDSTEDNS